MKKRIVSMVLAVITLGMLTACGSEKPVAEAPVEVVKEEPECEHEWIEADYWNAKTCSKCGETDGEPVKAAQADRTILDVDTEYDMPIIICDNNQNPIGTHTAKVWFTNYSVFDSDETHEAKDGYEWKTVEAHIAFGEKADMGGWLYDIYDHWGLDYYENTKEIDGEGYITYRGKDYPLSEMEYNKIELAIIQNKERPELAQKYGWPSNIAVFEEVLQIECLLPKGFDGALAGYGDYFEYLAKDKDLEAVENIVSFRFK